MDIEIITKTFSAELIGLSGKIVNQQYGPTGIALMNKFWEKINAGNIETKGINHWIYEPGDKMFVGAELKISIPEMKEFEARNISIEKYARLIHTGPYDDLKKINDEMRMEIVSRNLEFIYPCIEIYSHIQEDGSMPVTEVIWTLK